MSQVTELKHLSTLRNKEIKRDCLSRGDRKRIRACRTLVPMPSFLASRNEYLNKENIYKNTVLGMV